MIYYKKVERLICCLVVSIYILDVDAHILNILVQDGMSVVGHAIELIIDLVRHVNSSASRIQAFNEIAERECIATKTGLVFDIPNRSNSTHAMILEAIEYKIVLKRYTTSQQQPFPTELEWSKTESIGKFLGVFEETTRAFSADRFPTSHMFLVNVLYIQQALQNHAWQGDRVIKELAAAMDKNFDKYWDVNYNMVLVIATILDPRHKFDFLDFFYEKVCENFVDIDLSKNMAKDWLGKYFRKYEEVIRRNGTSLGPQVDVSNSMASYSPVLMQGKRKIHREFAQFRS